MRSKFTAVIHKHILKLWISAPLNFVADITYTMGWSSYFLSDVLVIKVFTTTERLYCVDVCIDAECASDAKIFEEKLVKVCCAALLNKLEEPING